MTDPSPDKPRRRPRYSGTHPRQFHEKYKELQPDQYAADVAKVLASGKTPAGMHRSIMVGEVLQALAPRPGEVAVDCTLGFGGHALELWKAVQPGGRLLGVDADPIELAATEARLRGWGCTPETLRVTRLNFAGAAGWILGEAPDGADCVLADFGLSSMQIDNPERGFTFKYDGPLDMRMNPQRGRTAAELLGQLDEGALAELLSENADEPHAVLLAAAMLRAHADRPLQTTRELANVVQYALQRQAGLDEAAIKDAQRRIFQALRIAVNDELGSIDALLRSIPYALKPGGRLAVLTFHSGEDRRVKHAFRAGLRDGIYSRISEEVVRAGPEERRANPRSASAKLRWAVRAT
jgi:16S rRNA (cytosine1402-N4)-methyltransferase